MSENYISYYLPNIQKPMGLNHCVENLFSGTYVGMTHTGNSYYDLSFKRPLTTEERSALDSMIANYTDPESWLVLNNKESMTMATVNTNSTDFVDMHTFIMTNGSEYATPCTDLKTIINCNTANVEAFANYDENANDTITLQIKCSTRDVVVEEAVIDVSDILLEWKNKANNGQTGYVQNFKSHQIYGIAEKTPSNYDCVWCFRGKVSNPLMHFSLNGFQKLFYVRMYE